jgi:hypothetical protein
MSLVKLCLKMNGVTLRYSKASKLRKSIKLGKLFKKGRKR